MWDEWVNNNLLFQFLKDETVRGFELTCFEKFENLYENNVKELHLKRFLEMVSHEVFFIFGTLSKTWSLSQIWSEW